MKCLIHPKVCAMAHADIEVFSAYRAGYTWKKLRYPRGPQHSCRDGLKNSFNHENLQKLYQNARGEHE